MKIEISICLQDLPHCISGEFDTEDDTVIIESTVSRPNGALRKTRLVANKKEFDAFMQKYAARRGELQIRS